jgi:hypothetical protein
MLICDQSGQPTSTPATLVALHIPTDRTVAGRQVLKVHKMATLHAPEGQAANDLDPLHRAFVAEKFVQLTYVIFCSKEGFTREHSLQKSIQTGCMNVEKTIRHTCLSSRRWRQRYPKFNCRRGIHLSHERHGLHSRHDQMRSLCFTSNGCKRVSGP